jgi:hypothetical protein
MQVIYNMRLKSCNNITTDKHLLFLNRHKYSFDMGVNDHFLLYKQHFLQSVNNRCMPTDNNKSTNSNIQIVFALNHM